MPDQLWTPPDEEQAAENIAFWDSVSHIEGCPTKQFDKKTYQGTSWDPTWAKMYCTRLWGRYGKTWGLKNVSIIQVPGEKSQTVGLIMTADFFCPASEPFWTGSDIKYVPHGETIKKLETDVIKKALTYLGFAAAIYLGQFDDDPHANQPDDEGIDQRTPHEFAEAAVRTLKDATSLKRVGNVETWCKDRHLKTYYMQQVFKAAHDARVRIQAAESMQQASDVFDGKDEDGESQTKEGQA